MRPWLIAGLFLLVPAARAADDLAVLEARSSPRSMLRTYLLAEAKKHFDARRAAVAKLKTPADVLARQKQLRARFIQALGGPPARTARGATGPRCSFRIFSGCG